VFSDGISAPPPVATVGPIEETSALSARLMMSPSITVGVKAC
jgi:hypothetical protein